MKKHKFNIFPEAKEEDYKRLLGDIRDKGYDLDQPVIVYQGDILDGWNRYRCCQELGETAPVRQFIGNDTQAIEFVMRTNKRRNLSSGQWATIAVEAEDLLETIAKQVEKERREKQAKTQASPIRQKIAEQPIKDDSQTTAHKAAELFNTNRTYVNQAAQIKKSAPEAFEKVKAGKMKMQDAMREVRKIPTSPWLPDEEQRKIDVMLGKAVVANAQRDKNLIQWAEKEGCAAFIDRSSPYGNPYIMGKDGDRDEVCDKFRDHYMTYKSSFNRDDLRRRVLICHCYPERCHGDELVKWANK